MDYDAFYAFRDGLEQRVELDLIGPAGGPEEVIQDPPITQYVAGVLYARDSGALSPADDIDAPDEDGEGVAADPPVALASIRYPSSMGMTFTVAPQQGESIEVAIAAGRYEQIHENDEELWKRIPVQIPPISIDPTTPTSHYFDTQEAGLRVFCRVRSLDADGLVPITVVLVNWNTRQKGEKGDGYAYFQPTMRATARSGSGCFAARGFHGQTGDDEDLDAYRMLYRHISEFGVGHGCSVEWQEDPGRPDRAVAIATTFVPKQVVRLFGSNPAIDSSAISIGNLARSEREEVLASLSGICDGYSDWIEARAAEVDGIPEQLRKTATDHLNYGRAALARMRDGVELISSDSGVWRAFRLMNAAMLRQRARATWLNDGKPAGGPDEGADHRWYPFQLAFILLCIRGIYDPDSADRELADLLWFPTGGGKTEAYLGLIAFTTFLRRLRHQDGGGVTALMRYTLRLLTTQQFERASLLIACCESIRRENGDLGDEEISIGLWVGRDSSPLTLKEARDALNKLRTGASVAASNPIQLHSCPWCGQGFDHRNYFVGERPHRLNVRCGNKDCEFEKRLPVYVVDDDIYEFHPTLIIATVDKYASLPWREKTRSLFNLDRPNQPPPELIVQDELHLISGPLGTVVGLYETALDMLCSEEGRPPKVVASTATIRRAGRQTRGLFNRTVSQFPPPGIDARDSYFAVEMSPAEKGSRLYVGLMAPGTSHTTLLVRTYAALLQGVSEMEAPPDVKDPYWTLVGYFNSLRILGGARMQVQDDVNDRIGLLASRHGSEPRKTEALIELTSRESSGTIPDHLARMANKLPSPEVLDVILATNMISVGVDIDRLGLMTVMGQPQATSEYIQATSRVGRRYPGLVFVLFNSARSRDRSHYESFVTYHSALYRQVEATSVTPFSPRARDRALHAVLVALARLTIPELRDNGSAGDVSAMRDKLEALIEVILARVASVSERDLTATREQLEGIVKHWIALADAGELVYSDYKGTRTALLESASEALGQDDALPTLWSMRDVDQESNLYLVR